MIEELKIIADIFKNATDGALYAWITFILYQLAKTALIILPIVNCVKYIAGKIFIGDENENSKD